MLGTPFKGTWAWFLGDGNTLHRRPGFVSRTGLDSRILFSRNIHGCRTKSSGRV